jgi:hypothetical protein
MTELFRHLRILLLLGCLLAPLPALAQELPPDLVVRLRDSADTGISTITVIVRDASGHELLRARTDASGKATFERLPVSQVRVAVQGSLPSGKQLYLPGQDAPGIWLLLDSPPVQLDLRAEADGLVRPDPATMIAPEVGVPLSPVAAISVTALPRPSAAPSATPALVISEAPGEAHVSDSFPWIGLFIVIFLAGAATLVIVAVRRGRSI